MKFPENALCRKCPVPVVHLTITRIDRLAGTTQSFEKFTRPGPDQQGLIRDLQLVSAFAQDPSAIC